MLLNEQLSPAMGLKVLNYLKNLEKLPTSGFVAGQSVLSALLALYGKEQMGPINDIDIYVNERKQSTKIRSHSLSFNPDLLSVNYINPSEEERRRGYDGVTKLFSASRTSLFRLSEVTYDGLVNFVKVKNFNENFPLTPYQVLESFDLNMVKVGVNLADKRLYWTKDFEFFVKTGQLEVTSAVSPFHTACRIEKKLKEMPWIYTNRELNAKTLLLPRLVYNKVYNKEHPADSFGKKYNSIFKKYPNLKEMFSISKIKNKDFYTSTLTDSAKLLIPETEIETIVAKLRENFTEGTLHMASMALSKKIIDSSYLKKGKHYESSKKVIGDTPTFSYHQFQLLDQVYVDGQVQLEWANRIENFIKKHRSMSKYFVGYSLADQTKIYKNIKELQTTYGEYIVGLLETNNFTKEDILSLTNLNQCIKKYHDSQSKPFKNFVPLPSYRHGDVQITDLKSKLELMQEGNEMRHCVGGYAGSVESGRSRILSLRSEETDGSIHRSTAELGKMNTSLFDQFGVTIPPEEEASFRCPIYVGQHRNFANGVPIEKHQRALEEYVNEHNKKYIEPLMEKFPWDEELNTKLNTVDFDLVIPQRGKMEKLKIRHLAKADLVNKAMSKNRYQNQLIPCAGLMVYSDSMSLYYYFYIGEERSAVRIDTPNTHSAYTLNELEQQLRQQYGYYSLTEQIAYMLLSKVI